MIKKIINELGKIKIIRYPLFYLRYFKRDRKQTFEYIYNHKKWGGAQDGEFYSGEGSHEDKYVLPYIELIKKIIEEYNINSIVDLGCGDFNIGKRIVNKDVKYEGVDIVDDMIEQHNRSFGSEKIHFSCLDIVEDDLPNADLCLVRQVLQHLNNSEISRVLPKLKKYKYVIVTEHVTQKAIAKTYNHDKVHGQHIRADYDSGVYLDELPYSLRVKTLLRIPYGDEKTELLTVQILSGLG